MVDITKALSIEGWMSEAELMWLAEQASKHTNIVEIGSWMGRSTRALCDNTQGKVCAVDVWYPNDVTSQADAAIFRTLLAGKPDIWLYEQFMSNMQGTRVEALKMTSVEAARACSALKVQFDMVFIDGSHDYDSVKADILAWRPLVNHGGLLCGHDAPQNGVKQAVSELIPNYTVAEGTTIWVSQ